MAKKLGLLAIAAAVLAYAPIAAWGCSDSSAQMNDGTKVAQGYGSPAAQPMPDSTSGSQPMGQSDTGTTNPDSSTDK
ncbi:MAG TPA: hypothetical protein VJS41_01570 [Stellaceae bacterium]|nr:hypothetical protein [Stellaceae bacterium]